MRELGRVAKTFLIPNSTDSIVLFSWAADPEKLGRNVARVDFGGKIVWRAELPEQNESDCFVNLAREGNDFVARTYREWVVRINAEGETRRAERESSTT